MGTNYYAVKNACPCCKRQDIEHIGKSSYGWAFSFQATDTIRDFESWLENVKSADKIINEYDEEVTVDELLHTIEAKRGGKNFTMVEDYKRHLRHSPREEWLDQCGNSFHGYEFE